MDHVLEAIRPHYDAYLDMFMEEHRKGEYKKLSDNPFYDEVKALIDAMNCIRKHMGWDNIKLSEEVEYYG